MESCVYICSITHKVTVLFIRWQFSSLKDSANITGNKKAIFLYFIYVMQNISLFAMCQESSWHITESEQSPSVKTGGKKFLWS